MHFEYGYEHTANRFPLRRELEIVNLVRVCYKLLSRREHDESPMDFCRGSKSNEISIIIVYSGTEYADAL